MFQPHSVRGLLSRRNQTRLHSQQQLQGLQAGGDEDLDSMVETKLIIKGTFLSKIDVEHKIEDIRQWRDHQRLLFQQKLACNEAVAKVTISEYLSHLDRQAQQQDEQRLKILKKLVIEEQREELEEKGWNNSDTNLFEHLANSNKLVEMRKYEQENQVQEAETTNTQAFLSNLETISGTILRRDQGAQKRVKESAVDHREKIKRQLQEIQNELKEFQDLYKD